jgi:hypothetical protein
MHSSLTNRHSHPDFTDVADFYSGVVLLKPKTPTQERTSPCTIDGSQISEALSLPVFYIFTKLTQRS